MKEYIQKILTGEREKVISNLKNGISNEEKTILVTANSECFVFADENPKLKSLLLDKNTKIVIDGIAALKSFQKLGSKNVTKVPGVDIVKELLLFANEQELKISVLGGTPESSSNFKKYITDNFSKIKISGYQDGFIQDKIGAMKDFSHYEPDIVLVALGVPAQELLIADTNSFFTKGLFIGCGGSLDVLGKTKKRAPKLFRATSTEWLYRIIREPKRIGRFAKTNFKFLKMTNESKRK